MDTANVLVELVEDGYNENDIATTLQSITDVYGQIFQKHSRSSGSPRSLTRRRVKNGKAGAGQLIRTGVSGQTQSGVSRGNSNNSNAINSGSNSQNNSNASKNNSGGNQSGKYSKDDTIFDDFEDEVMFTADGGKGYQGL